MQESTTGIRPGMHVRAADGKSLGRVVECWDEYFEAKRGTFYDHVFMIPTSDIGRIRGNTVELVRPSGEIANILAGHVIRSTEAPTRHEANDRLQSWLNEHPGV